MKKVITDVTVDHKKVFVRADFNVPLDENGHITDDTRIQKTLPTIRYLLDHHAAVILASHLGRPKGKVVPAYSLKPVAARLTELLGQPVQMAPDCVGAETEKMAAGLKDGDVLLLENLRFHAEEEKNDPEFSRQLASLADVGIDDAFGCCHRAHASVAGIAEYLPLAAGFLLEKEIRFLGDAVENPAHPFAAIIGGAKVSDKIGVINNLLEKVDTLIVGGGMAYTFFKAQGYGVGSSLCEEDKIDLAKDMLKKAEEKGVKFLLPVDNKLGDKFAEDCQTQYTDSDKIPEGWMGMDIGPKSIELFCNAVKDAGTVIWNGPMGVFEFPAFAEGTLEVAKAIAASGAISIIGGGDSVAAVTKLGFADKMTHISTGGGASLEFLEGLELPGIAALNEK